MDLQKAFKEHWSNFSIEGVTLLAVSGGSDSMVMAELFHSNSIPMAIAHCNFQLRGADSDGDQAFVKDWAEQREVSFHTISFDTEKKMEEWGKGVQETARILRYTWLEQIRAEHDYGMVATAHHANDNAETLLMNLFKGTGISGLHGIPVVSGNVVRPLLFVEKKDINAFIEKKGIPYREDASNATDKYLRNAVRHHLIPKIEELFPNAVSALNENTKRFTEVEELYTKAVQQEIKQLEDRRGNDVYISIKKLAKRTPLHTICFELFRRYHFAPTQVPQIIALLESDSGSQVLSPSYRVIRDRDFLIITKNDTQETDLIVIDNIPHVVNTADGNLSFKTTSRPTTIPSGSNIAYIDIEQIAFPLKLRRWKKGDYFYPLGMGMKKKKLSDYFIDQKVPLHDKERAWVLESNNRIVWVVGMRLDERFKLRDHTKDEVLQVTWSKT